MHFASFIVELCTSCANVEVVLVQAKVLQLTYLLIQKAITVIVFIVDIRNVVVVIVVVVHMVLETVSIRVLAQVLRGKDKPKKSKKEEDGENEFGGSHVYLK